MVDSDRPKAPALTRARLAWLQEIGIDKRLLSRYRAVDAGPLSVTPRDRRVDASMHPAQIADATMPDATMPDAQPASTRATQAKAKTTGAKTTGVRKGDAQVRVERVSIGPDMPRNLETLASSIAVCQACPLHSGRSQTVFGSGATASADWMIIGEAPGDHDDREGLPFQGTAGALLQAMLHALTVPADAVFLTNLVKCRPLGNRTPKPDEVAACLPYLHRQIALLKPRRILALGRLATQTLLNSDAAFDELRGHIHELHGEAGERIPLVATYHPAFLLSRPQFKACAWRDLNLARSISFAA